MTLVPRVITRFVCCAVPGQQKEGKANRMAENKAKPGNTWFMEKERKENSSRAVADKTGTQNLCTFSQ